MTPSPIADAMRIKPASCSLIGILIFSGCDWFPSGIPEPVLLIDPN